MTARTLLVVRHAKSDWDTPAPDNERPINARPWLSNLIVRTIVCVVTAPLTILIVDWFVDRTTWARPSKTW